MRKFIDQMQREVIVSDHPRRIISLVPSQSELLFDLGLDEEVVGITKFCIHPREQWKKKVKIGGTKRFHLDRIASLAPDLIIGNKEENYREGIEELSKSYPVWMSDIVDLADALAMIEEVGRLVNRGEASQEMSREIRSQFDNLSQLTSPKLRTAYFIWCKPYMVAGKGTFIQALLNCCGFDNVFAELERYPSVTLEEVKARKPELLLFSSEPYPFKEVHLSEFRAMFPESLLLLVDGEMFSWYGSHLLQAPQYLTGILESLAER